MQILATGKPRAKVIDDCIVITIPSGDDTLEIALTPHHALHLVGRTQGAMADFLSETSKRPAADVIPFPGKKRAKAGRR